MRTLVKRGATLGTGSIIMAGVTVGEYAMVGAGAFVARDVRPYALVKGNPAKVSGWVCRCGRPLALEDLRSHRNGRRLGWLPALGNATHQQASLIGQPAHAHEGADEHRPLHAVSGCVDEQYQREHQ